MNQYSLFGISLGATAGLVVGLVVASPASAVSESVAAPSAAVSVTHSVIVKSKKRPGFRSSQARYGVANSGSVRNLQRALIRKHYGTRSLKHAGATGNYLAATRTSVRKVQRAMGYRGADADGIVGRSSATKIGLRWIQSAKTSSRPKQAPAAQAPTSNPPQATQPAQPIRVATFPGGRNVLSGAVLKNVIGRAGFSGAAICKAWGIAMRESGGYPGIMGPMNSNGTYDHGLFQINDVHRANISFAKIYDPVYNAHYAYWLSDSGTNFSHWGLGDSGWAGQLKKQNKEYWQMLQDRAAQYAAQCNRY